MKPIRANYFVLCLTLMLVLLSSTLVWANPEDTKKEESPEKKVEVIKTIKHVVLIALDGVNEKDLEASSQLRSLASMGVKAKGLIPVKPEGFSVNTASLLTGLDPSKHSYLKQGDKLAGSTIIDIYQKSNREVLFVDGTAGGLRDLGGKSTLYRPTSTEQAVGEVEKYFPKEKPFLTSLFLTVDKTNTLKQVDQELGRLFSFFYKQGVYEYTLFVVTGAKESEGFAIYKGPGIKGGIIEHNSRLVDVCPTIVKVTDGKAPDKVDGLVLWNVLTSGNGFTELGLLQRRVSELSQSQVDLTRKLYMAKEEKRVALLEKESVEVQKGKALATMDNKDEEIKALKLKIAAMKFLGVMMVVGFGIGYIIEYFVLRKKFLMF